MVSPALLVPTIVTAQNPGAQARLHLLHANRDAIAVMLARAAAGGLELADAVVLVVDQRDPVGQELAQAAGENGGLDATVEGARAEHCDQIPTAIIVIDLRSARALFADGHPAVACGLVKRPARGQVRTVVVAASAAMLVHAEIPITSPPPE